MCVVGDVLQETEDEEGVGSHYARRIGSNFMPTSFRIAQVRGGGRGGGGEGAWDPEPFRNAQVNRDLLRPASHRALVGLGASPIWQVFHQHSEGAVSSVSRVAQGSRTS